MKNKVTQKTVRCAKCGGIFLTSDPARGRHEPRIYAEVVVRPGEDEAVLYTTPYYPDWTSAIADAERWMRENGVVEAEV